MTEPKTEERSGRQPVRRMSRADRADLREKLTVASGGVVFTTIQKFLPSPLAPLHLQWRGEKGIVTVRSRGVKG